MKRAMQILCLTCLCLVVGVLASCASRATERDEPPIFERGTWALSSFKGKQAPYHYAISNYKFDYNEQGQIVQSRKSINAANIVNGENLTCTWADDGFSYDCSYTLTGGNFGELGSSGTAKASFQVEYNELSATYTAHGESIPPAWKQDVSTVHYTLEYRTDGTLKHKEVVGNDFADALEVYDYDEYGNLVHYERTASGEDTPSEIRTYDIVYEDGVPKSVSVTKTFPPDSSEASSDAEGSQAERSHTYELVLHTDEGGNVVSADCDGRKMATMSWTYIERPDSLSRLRIQSEAASAFELL